ncbi:MAG: hypothetical protein AB6733_24580 [Clostridiaceae bacterium]
MKEKNTIVDAKLIKELEYNILGPIGGEMGFVVRLRDGSGLDKEKLENTYMILEKMIQVYDNYSQIDKEVIELIMNVPNHMDSFIEWNPGCEDEIETAKIEITRYIRRILKTE